MAAHTTAALQEAFWDLILSDQDLVEWQFCELIAATRRGVDPIEPAECAGLGGPQRSR